MSGRTHVPDAAPWHRAAAAWAALAARLDHGQSELAATGRDLATAWPAGAGAQPAQDRVHAQRAAVLDAREPVRRIATVLADHAHALAALRRLAHQELSPPEQLALRTRLRQLDERTSAALRADRPPPLPTRWVGARADRASVLAQRGRPPHEVRAWWRALTPAEREAALRAWPEVVGWLDGVPAADRDRANRAVLGARIEALAAQEARLASLADRLPPVPALVPVLLTLQTGQLWVREQLAGLETVRATLDAHADRALLLGVEAGTRGQDGRVVLALGDPDHARHTAVFVPGINTDLRDTPGAVAQAERLRVMADATTLAPRDVSVVYWLGYDPPQTQGALGYGDARAGAANLHPFVDGLRATHEPGSSHVTLVGHSYVSTVVAEAAMAGLKVDDIVAAGSPGMHTDHASRLGLDPRHVWSGLAPDDPVGGWLGELPFVHGQEPTDPAFGANRFVVDTPGHAGYWLPDSASLRNQAAIVVGRYDLVSLVHGALPTG
jgi:hypothetical protein